MVGLLQIATASFQIALLATVLEGIRRRNLSIVVNGTVGVIAAFLPAVVSYLAAAWYSTAVSFDPALALWLVLAGFLHQLGMLGWYDAIWWWDHLTHTVSGGLVAAAVYASMLALAVTPPRVAIPLVGVGGGTILLVFVVGVFWELIELFARMLARRFDIEPVLLHYGPGDTEFDLGFDLLGAVLVVALDLRLVFPLTREFPSVTRSVLVVAGWVVIISSLLMAIAVLADGTELPDSKSR